MLSSEAFGDVFVTFKLVVGLCEEHYSMLKAVMPSGSLREWGLPNHQSFCDFDCQDRNQCNEPPAHWHMLKVKPDALISPQPGSVISRAKSEAARANGAKGGRPVIKAWRPWCEEHKPLAASRIERVSVEKLEAMTCARRGCKNRCTHSF
jgi:hypothetical protein